MQEPPKTPLLFVFRDKEQKPVELNKLKEAWEGNLLRVWKEIRNKPEVFAGKNLEDFFEVRWEESLRCAVP